MRIVFRNLISLAASLAIAACAGPSQQGTSSLPHEIHVAIELSPLCLDINGDTLAGLSYDILQAWSRDNDMELIIEPYNNIDDATDSDSEHRLFVSNIPITARMHDRYIFTDPIYTDRTVLVQNNEAGADSLIGSPTLLGGKQVWITRNSPVLDRLNNLASEIGDTIIINEVEDYSEEQLGLLVAMGRIPRAAIGRYTAQKLAEKFPNLDIDTHLSFNQFRSWMLNPADSVLRDSINSWLRGYVATKEYEGILKKYHLD